MDNSKDEILNELNRLVSQQKQKLSTLEMDIFEQIKKEKEEESIEEKVELPKKKFSLSFLKKIIPRKWKRKTPK